MKTVPFGPHKGQRIDKMRTDDLQRLSDWVDERLNGQDRPKGSQLTQWTHLLLAIRRELKDRDDAEPPEAELEGPQPLLSILPSSAVKIFLGLVRLRSLNGGVEPFPSTYEKIMEVTGIGSSHTIANAKRSLTEYRLIQETTRGEARFVYAENALSTSNPIDLLFSLEHLEKDSTHYRCSEQFMHTTVLEAFKRLDLPNPDDKIRRQALERLRDLVKLGYTAEDALKVAAWGRRMWNTGEQRWVMMLDLPYLWSTPKFATHLLASNSKAAQKEFHVGGMEDPDSDARKNFDEWKEKRLAEIKEEDAARGPQ